MRGFGVGCGTPALYRSRAARYDRAMRTLGVNSRLKPFGATIFAEMTALAVIGVAVAHVSLDVGAAAHAVGFPHP